MLTITERYTGSEHATDTLVLPFELRQKSRLRVTLGSGVEAALNLERGGVLRGGELLHASDGRIIAVVAAPETLMRVRALTPLQLARAAYHLGNRHVPLQVGANWLLLERDHVLEHMLLGLGVEITAEEAPFEPEGGAYAHQHRSENGEDRGAHSHHGHHTHHSHHHN